MANVKCKPTSPGRRFVVQITNKDLHRGAPHAPLLAPRPKKGGRNSHGRITVRHQGGGHKRRYRVIDFKRNKDGIPATVERLEYDPNRSANIALLLYSDGERRYVLAPKGISAGDQLVSGPQSPIKVGNALPLANIPVGTQVHCVELYPGRGAQLAQTPAPARTHLRRGSLTPAVLRAVTARADSARQMTGHG